MIKRLAFSPLVKVKDKGGREVNLASLVGRRIKNTKRLPDGSIVAVIDNGKGERGVGVLFACGEDYEKCCIKE